MVRETPPKALQAQAHSQPTISEAEAYALLTQHESGGRYDAVNPSSGACGVLQSLPCSKLPCSLDDKPCQDSYFTAYMRERYGSWRKAWDYWQCIGICTNKYGTVYKVTTWW